MRFTANLLLTIIFVILSLIALLAGTLKFQLLNYNFWTNTFEKSNVYQSLADSTKSSVESQIGKEGGSQVDAKVLTDLITTANVKEFVDRNIQNVLTFANGKSSKIIVYVPVDKFPENLLPKNLNGIKAEMSLSDLLTKFNYQNYSSLPLNNLAHSGEFTSVVFTSSVGLLLVVIILLFLLVEVGKKFIAPGIALIISGLLTISISKFVESLTALQSIAQGNTSFVYILVGNLFPPLLSAVTGVWYLISVGLIIIGLVLFFVRKPGYNQEK